MAAVVAALLVTTAQPTTAAPDKSFDQAPPSATAVSTEPESIPQHKRSEVIGKDWQESTDIAWTTAGDASGFHVLAAQAREGYAWRTVTSLVEPGFDADQWIGNACATASGQKLVVVYAPRTFTNKPDLFERGAFTAIVDLVTGAVSKLPVSSTLAYYSPGCGSGERALITQQATELNGKSRLVEVDAAAATAAKPIEVLGQVTSAIPTKDGIVAADAGRLITVDAKGAARTLAKTSSLPFHLKADSSGGVVFLDSEGGTSYVRRLERAVKNAPMSTLAKGPLTELGLTSSANGKVFITGKNEEINQLPATVVRADVPKPSTMSVQGEIAVTGVMRAKPQAQSAATTDPADAHLVRIEAKVAATGKNVAFTVLPNAASGAGRVASPKLSTAGGEMTASGSPNSPLDDESVCAVPRNKAGLEVYQPTPRQVEWAVDYAVTNGLYIQREANWKNSGMETAWKPQELFPPIPLEGGGSVPPQVMLGILAQESNLWQAARFALPGVTANPLVGNFYGVNLYDSDPQNDWEIRWSHADCGYGITQITDGMRKAGREKPDEVALPAHKQLAAVVDFATNIAAGLRILQDKWNQTRKAGMKVNDGDPQWLENWYFAVWAYNSGFKPQNGTGPWGLGWANNPANPNYPRDRTPFLESGYSDAAHPQHWSYPEKVMGWAGHPIEAVVSPGVTASGYMYTWWNNNDYRRRVKPDSYLFCVKTKNDCDEHTSVTPDKPDDPNTPEDEGTIGEPIGPCAHRDAAGYYDLLCWWHESSTWKSNCAEQCGNQTNRFRDPDVGYQPDGVSYPPNCSPPDPTGMLIVDDSSAPSARACTKQPNSGTFDLQFGSDREGRYPSKIDFHQIGAGFNSHFWFSHTNRNDEFGTKMKVTGTWTLNQPINGWSRVLVHLPDHGAHTQQARYEIHLGNGKTEFRYISQRTEENKWVSLGVYPFAGTPKVRLSSVTQEGSGVDDVAWDAVAFQPLPGKPKHIIAALGDSFSSGEGAGNYYRETDINHGTPQWNACRRSKDAWSRKFTMPGKNGYIGDAADKFPADVELGFVACSGALTWQIDGGPTGNSIPRSWDTPNEYETGNGQFREIRQLESGVLTEHTTLVTLSIGGNDAGFTDVLVNCVSWDCTTATAKQEHRQWIDEAQPRVQQVLERVRMKAPSAKIVLMGYPELFSRAKACGFGIISTETDELADLAQYMNEKLKQTANSVGSQVSFADPRGRFTGKGACDQDPVINFLVLGPRGDGDFHVGDRMATCLLWDSTCVSRTSLHPNVAGAYVYGRVLEDKLKEINYGQ
ncbi:SGNH/GDSL hydrolase family protein [Nocardia sp. NRRL S-836]|uniref:golvesin C-terminal-like domain-containing protein n=1 Tax=Nocardia sp. NRRL S-836 TaxID=1519492 RepID=UPI0018D07D0B|nr:SGNH/GDSL hydrolase family protein [Nocardia sp. NRRL S-836]